MRKKTIAPSDEPKEVDPMNDYETKGHLNTILDAHQIMTDPEKMKKVHALAGRHMKAIRSLKDLKAVAQDKLSGKMPMNASVGNKLGSNSDPDNDAD